MGCLGRGEAVGGWAGRGRPRGSVLSLPPYVNKDGAESLRCVRGGQGAEGIPGAWSKTQRPKEEDEDGKRGAGHTDFTPRMNSQQDWKEN